MEDINELKKLADIIVEKLKSDKELFENSPNYSSLTKCLTLKLLTEEDMLKDPNLHKFKVEK